MRKKPRYNLGKVVKMNNNGQPSNRIISRKFVETTIIILFVLNLIASLALLITGIVYNANDNNEAMNYYISAVSVFLGCCIFLSFLIVNILKVCELEKMNAKLDNKEPQQSATELLTLLADLQKREVITQTEYDQEKQRVLDKM